MCSLFGYRKKAKGNKKEGDNEVTVLTPKDSLVLHEAYQFLVKKYIPTQSRAPPKQGQITEKSTIESIKDMSLKDKKNNRKQPNNNAGNTENRKSSDPDSAGSGSPSDQEEASDEGEDHHEEIKISSKNKDDEDQADADQEDEDEDDE